MRKISRAQEQHGGLNFRNAHDESVRNITQQPFNASEGTDRGGHVRRLAPGEGKHPFEPVTEDWYVYDQCKHCDKQQNHENHSNVNEFHLFGSKKTANQYIEKQGDKWVITQKGTGKVLSHHDSEEKANEAFSAMMANKHGNINFDDSDWRSQYSDLDSDW
jgi:hypothetical protein